MDTIDTDKGPRVTSWEKDTWCVWCKTGHRPSFFHPDRARAEAEAERLAAKHPGRNFLVLHTVSKFGVEPTRQPTPAVRNDGDL